MNDVYTRVAKRANDAGTPITAQCVMMIARFIAEDPQLCPSQYTGEPLIQFGDVGFHGEALRRDC